MDCSMPGFPVLHHLPELAQTHVHWVMPSNHLILCCPLRWNKYKIALWGWNEDWGNPYLSFLALRIYPNMKQQVIRTLFVLALTLMLGSRCFILKMLFNKNPRATYWPNQKTLSFQLWSIGNHGSTPASSYLPDPSLHCPPYWCTVVIWNLCDKRSGFSWPFPSWGKFGGLPQRSKSRVLRS